MPKTRRPQQGRQPSKEREREREKKNTIKLNNNNKTFDRTTLKVNRKKKLKLRDYSPSTPSKKALAPILNFCGSVASTIMLGSSFHSLAFGNYSPPTRFNCRFEQGVGGLEGHIGLPA